MTAQPENFRPQETQIAAEAANSSPEADWPIDSNGNKLEEKLAVAQAVFEWFALCPTCNRKSGASENCCPNCRSTKVGVKNHRLSIPYSARCYSLSLQCHNCFVYDTKELCCPFCIDSLTMIGATHIYGKFISHRINKIPEFLFSVSLLPAGTFGFTISLLVIGSIFGFSGVFDEGDPRGFYIVFLTVPIAILFLFLFELLKKRHIIRSFYYITLSDYYYPNVLYNKS